MSQWKATENLLTANDSGRRGFPARFIAVHTTEGGDTVRGIAEWQLKRSARSSYHVLIARDGSSVRSNDDEFIPWAAGPMGNRYCYHVALAGRAAFTREDWLARPDQLAALADYLAVTADLHGIALRRATAADLQAGARGDRGPSGVCGHVTIRDAWGEVDHWDPGPGFPYDHVMELARGGGGVVPDTHTVTRGDTLYRIGQRHGITWHRLAELNGIPEPFVIHPGQVLRLR